MPILLSSSTVQYVVSKQLAFSAPKTRPTWLFVCWGRPWATICQSQQQNQQQKRISTNINTSFRVLASWALKSKSQQTHTHSKYKLSLTRNEIAIETMGWTMVFVRELRMDQQRCVVLSGAFCTSLSMSPFVPLPNASNTACSIASSPANALFLSLSLHIQSNIYSMNHLTRPKRMCVCSHEWILM